MKHNVQKKSGNRRVAAKLGVSAAALCIASPVMGQDTVRSSRAGEDALAARKAAIQNQVYNISVGNIKLRTGVGVGGEYIDNEAYVQNGRREDYIVRGTANVGISVPVTEANQLTFDLKAGYAKYLNTSSLDHFILAPGTEISFDLSIGDALINIHDRATHLQETVSFGTLSGVAEMERFENTGGLSVEWDLNKVNVSVGYDHYNWWSISSAFKNLDRTSDTATAKIAYLLNPATKWGVELGYAKTDYRVQNSASHLHNNDQYNAGVFVVSDLSENLKVTADVGYTKYKFQKSGGILDNSDVSTVYFHVSAQHRLNDKVSHTLGGGRDISQGLAANSTAAYTLHEDIVLNLIKDVTLTVPLMFEYSQESDVAVTPGAPQGPERYKRYGAGVDLGYQLTPKLNTKVGYRFIKKESNGATRDYTANSVTLDLNYTF
jgi:hypothetical protein